MSVLPRAPRLIVVLLVFGAVLAGGVVGAGEKSAPPSDEQVAKLIEQLGDKDFSVRQQAQQELGDLGFRAYDAVLAATHHQDLEIATRARYLLGLMRMRWCDESDPPEVREQLDKYNTLSTDGRFRRIRALARLRNGAGVLPLCRLVQFEESELLSKYAAIELLTAEPADHEGQARLGQTLREQLGQSKRVAAKWLLTYADLRDKPAAAEKAWAEQVAAEEALARSSPSQSNSHIVLALLYHLAEVQAGQGHKEQAEATAERALRLNPGHSPAELIMRLEVAQSLQHRGLFSWADKEYEQVVKAGVPQLAFVALVTRSEMWHDQGRNLDAANSLRDAIVLVERLGPGTPSYIDRTPEELRARMNYFLACHWEEQKDGEKQLECLEKALENDPSEIDVLIACWRLDHRPPEFRDRVAKLIDRAAAQMLVEIGNLPDDPNVRNQFAWLVGNTTGDLDEALRCSLKSLELVPNSGAFYDTLAHVYFGKGDLTNAVKNQARAAELEPHSGLIRQELARFRAELERPSGKAKGAQPPTPGENAGQPASGKVAQ